MLNAETPPRVEQDPQATQLGEPFELVHNAPRVAAGGPAQELPLVVGDAIQLQAPIRIAGTQAVVAVPAPTAPQLPAPIHVPGDAAANAVVTAPAPAPITATAPTPIHVPGNAAANAVVPGGAAANAVLPAPAPVQLPAPIHVPGDAAANAAVAAAAQEEPEDDAIVNELQGMTNPGNFTVRELRYVFNTSSDIGNP